MSAGSATSVAATAARASSMRWRTSGHWSGWARPTASSRAPLLVHRPLRLGRHRPAGPGVQVDPGRGRGQEPADGRDLLRVGHERGHHARIISAALFAPVNPLGGTVAGFARPELLATPDWLAENLGRPDLRVLDLRWRPDSTAATLHAAGHIPGAVHLDWRAAVTATSEGSDALLLAPPDRMAAVMSRAGVGDGTSAVLYDDTLSYYASRVWWSLRAYGYESARILEGGYPAWQDAGKPVANGVPDVAPAVFTPRAQVRAAAHDRRRPGAARRPGRAPRGRARAGRVPRVRGQRPAPRPYPRGRQRAGRRDAPAGHRSGCAMRASCGRSCSRRTSPAAAASSATTGRASPRRSSPTS